MNRAKVAVPEVIEAMKKAAAASVAYVIPEVVDGSVQFAILDDSHPEGGFVLSFPLAEGVTYALIPLPRDIVIPPEKTVDGFATF